MELVVTCSNIFNLRIREKKFKARENQNLLVCRSNSLLWKNSLPVVPIDIAENQKTVETIKVSPGTCNYSLSSLVPLIASHYNIKII